MIKNPESCTSDTQSIIHTHSPIAKHIQILLQVKNAKHCTPDTESITYIHSPNSKHTQILLEVKNANTTLHNNGKYALYSKFSSKCKHLYINVGSNH